MIDNLELENILETADDLIIVAEIYAAAAVPTVNGFDPANALRCFASIANAAFLGISYDRLITDISGIKRSIESEVNSAQITFSNLTREIAEFEYDNGFEGLILVIREFSPSLSNSLSKSLILSVGRCEKPTSGSKQSLSVSSKYVVGAVDVEMPRRKFVREDPNGRVPTDILSEGFVFVPQYGVSTYSVRVKRGGLAGFFGFKKTIQKNLSYSSYSDLDANRVVPEVFGRSQISGMHLGYIDVGNAIRMQMAFCEGQIEDFLNTRSTIPNLPLSPTSYYEALGELGGVGTQTYGTNWVAPGYYSRTANIRCQADNSAVDVIEPAPDVVSVVLGRLVLTPNGAGIWNTVKWSDNASAHTRFALTSPDYRNLEANWIDDQSFFEVHKYNDEILFDSSLSDFLFLPNTTSFAAFIAANNLYLLPTGSITPDYFKYLKGDKTASETFNKSARAYFYNNSGNFVPIEPIEPPEQPVPGEIPPGGGSTLGLLYFLRRRYTCNVPITETVKLADFLNDTVFPTSRLFFAQNYNGKIRLGQKKPVDFGLAAATANTGENFINLDDVSQFVVNQKGFLLIDVHTIKSEIKKVVSAIYPVSQNSITLTATANITVAGFSGAANNATPSSAMLTVTSANADVDSSFTLDGIQTIFRAVTADSVQSVAGFIYATINAHPVLKRKFRAAWTPTDAFVTIFAKFGKINLESNLLLTHETGVAAPTIAPILAAAAGGDLKAGIYRVAYSYQNQRGQTLLSPFSQITVTANQKIDISTIAIPAGAQSLNWFCVPEANSARLRKFKTQTVSGAFSIISADLPRLTSPLPPDINRTFAECIRVAQVFSDRNEPRTGLAKSNILRSSAKWSLGQKNESTNLIELAYRDATQDFRLVKLILKDEAHIKKTKKTNKKTINGQGIDSFNQAYRIASGELAEKRDADFFYNWESTRKAFLLEEGDVIALTDDGYRVVNQPIFIETLEPKAAKFPTIGLTGRKYSNTLFDDSVAEREIPIAFETNNSSFVAAQTIQYITTNFTETRTFDAAAATIQNVANTLATVMSDLENNRK